LRGKTALRRASRGALLGCGVALLVTGIWFLTPYQALSLDGQVVVDLVAVCLWRAALVLMSIGYYASNPWQLSLLVAECGNVPREPDVNQD
jgi:hypothetical protein